MISSRALARTALSALVAHMLFTGCGGADAPRLHTTPTSATPPAPPSPAASAPKPPLPYPPTRTVDATERLHGQTVADPYRWLEREKSDEVTKWMSDENALARSELAKLPERDAIAARLRELFYVDSVGVPLHRGGRYFWTEREATKEKAIVYWKDGKTGSRNVLLDPNTWSADGHIALGGWWATWDGKTVAYKTKNNNSDEATMFVMDVASGHKSEIDVIEGAKYAAASWTPKGDGFYYVRLPVDPSIPPAERPGYAEIRFHTLGTDPKRDAKIYEATRDPTIFLAPHASKDGHYLFVFLSHGWSRTDVYFKDLRGKASGFKPLVTGQDAEFEVEEFRDRFYVRTNEGAPKYRVFSVDPRRSDRASWKEIIPERPDATLESIAIMGGKLVTEYLKDVATKLEIHELEGALAREVALPAIGSASLVGREDDDEAYLSFTSFTYPTEIHQTSIKSGDAKLWFKLKLPIDPSKFAVDQLFFASKDGTRIPMFVLHGKEVTKGTGKAPLLINGYGGFKASLTPALRSSVFPWLERGGVYAIVNLRGGSEYGETWHRAGMRRSKQNVFDDFTGAAEFLQREGWSAPQRTAILGASNGGLLVGAAITQRPDLYAVALCEVPLLDMVRYHQFGSGKTWIEEYGSADDEGDFKALYAYSPYHHVTKGTRYPAVLMVSADSDDRVDPMHARKFTAALQAASTGGPVLLRIEKNAGHGGADMVKALVEKIADEYAFALAHIGAQP
jgi:prolyl oligopeptidase